MEFHIEEIGTFNAEKAAKALIELANTIKKDDKEKNKSKNDKAI